MTTNKPSQLVIPKASAGETPENNEILALANNYLKQFPQIGEPGVFNFTYTGFVIQAQPAQALFLATNRTGETIADFAFQLDVSVNQEPIWKNTVLKLAKEDFGELPMESSMPVLVSIPEGKAEALLDAAEEAIAVSLSHLQRL